MTPNDVNTLSGKELKVSIGEASGASMIFRNSTDTVTGYGGYQYEELNWLALRLNFSLDMKPHKGINFGILMNNGSWTGMRGELQRKEVDIACSAFSGLLGYDVMDLAIFEGADGSGILTIYPKPQTSPYGHIMPFSLYVWIGLLLSVVACIGCLKLITVFDRKYLRQHRNNDDNFTRAGFTLSKIAVYIFATLTNHGGYYQNNGRRYAVGMMAFTWCLATFFFVNIYSSCLTSYLSLTFQRPDINSFKDLASNLNYHLVSLEGSTGEAILLGAKLGPMKEIGDRLRNCPKNVCRVNSFDQIKDKVLEGDNTVGLIVYTIGENYMLKTIVNNTCRLTMAQEKTAVTFFFMATQKNSPFSSLFFKESLWYHSLGLKNYWLKKMVPKTNQCQLQYNSKGETVKVVDRARLKLKQFYVAFAVLFTGYALAFIQFLRECFIHRG